jgi:hypothetical protein
MVMKLWTFFVTVLTALHFFLTSQRNLSTLIKVNHLQVLSKRCSASPKLLATKFSSRLS